MTEQEFNEIKDSIDNNVFHDLDCIRFLLSALDAGEVDTVITYGNKMLEGGQRYIAEVLANEVYGHGSVRSDDAAWMRLMNLATVRNELMEILPDVIARYDNECGLWVTGHQITEDYIETMKSRYNIDVAPEDVQHAFLKRNGSALSLTSEDTRYTLPITTCLTLNFEDITL